MRDTKTHKLTDEEFWSILRDNGGIYSRTARAIQRKYGVSYTRQSVYERAKAKPDLLEDIVEEAIDIAEEALFALIRTGQPATRLEAIKFFLKYQGKHRGYGDKPMEVAAQMSSDEPTGHTDTLQLTIRVVGNE